ncbi:MAG: hypothetical protein WCO75_08470 [Planctomycetota bacterium]
MDSLPKVRAAHTFLPVTASSANNQTCNGEAADRLAEAQIR